MDQRAKRGKKLGGLPESRKQLTGKNGPRAMDKCAKKVSYRTVGRVGVKPNLAFVQIGNV